MLSELEQIAEDHLKSSLNVISEALAPLSARQAELEARTESRLQSLTRLLTSLTNDIKDKFYPSSASLLSPNLPPTSTSKALANISLKCPSNPPTTTTTASPCTPGIPPYPLSAVPPSTDYSSSSNRDFDIDSASRTLAISPMTVENLLDFEQQLTNKVLSYFHECLRIHSNVVNSFSLEKLWYESHTSTVFVRFYSISMCYTVFSHLKNIPTACPDQPKVSTFILPQHKFHFKVLSNQAYRLRVSDPSSNTRIEYKNDSLVLSQKTDLKTWKIKALFKYYHNCSQCEKSFINKKELNYHNDVDHSTKLNSQLLNDDLLPPTVSESLPLTTSSVPSSFKCKVCSLLFTSRTDLESHKVSVHDQDYLRCSLCDLTFLDNC